jgi:hypothetical protein
MWVKVNGKCVKGSLSIKNEDKELNLNFIEKGPKNNFRIQGKRQPLFKLAWRSQHTIVVPLAASTLLILFCRNVEFSKLFFFREFFCV